jgi:hypothetical protein
LHRGAEQESRAQAGQQESGVLADAQSLNPEGDEHGGQRCVRRQEDGRDGKQGARAALRAQYPRTLEPAVTAIATALGLNPDELSAQFVTSLAALARTIGQDLAEPDWGRILDAFLLIAAHPAHRFENSYE